MEGEAAAGGERERERGQTNDQTNNKQSHDAFFFLFVRSLLLSPSPLLLCVGVS